VFCTSQVRNLKRFDGKNRLAFVSLHDSFVADQFPDLTYEQLMEQMYLVPYTESGYSDRRLGGMAAVRYLTRKLPKLWILAPILHIPFTHRIQQWAYQQIAKRRYKIAGKNDDTCDEDGTCELHFRK
jgi:predicted DCC family thiol-disulfide oxidoreductase YuxK